MPLPQLIGRLGWVALLTIVVGLAPLVLGLAYAVRPTERKLALMRPVSLAGLFAGLAGLVSGFAAGLASLARTAEVQAFTRETWARMAYGAAESLVSPFFAFACLTAAWLLVAAGMSRREAP